MRDLDSFLASANCNERICRRITDPIVSRICALYTHLIIVHHNVRPVRTCWAENLINGLTFEPESCHPQGSGLVRQFSEPLRYYCITLFLRMFLFCFVLMTHWADSCLCSPYDLSICWQSLFAIFCLRQMKKEQTKQGQNGAGTICLLRP